MDLASTIERLRDRPFRRRKSQADAMAAGQPQPLPKLTVLQHGEKPFSCPPNVATILTYCIVGTAETLKSAITKETCAPLVDFKPSLIDRVKPGSNGGALTFWQETDTTPCKVVVVVIPEVASRHNCEIRPDVITDLLKANLDPQSNSVEVFVNIKDAAQAVPATVAVARTFPQYSAKTSGAFVDTVKLQFVLHGGQSPSSLDRAGLQTLAEGVQLTCRLVDAPTSELHTDKFLDEINAVARKCGATVRTIRDEALEKQGFGGLWNVGKAADHPPALAIMSLIKGEGKKNICLVGKGIVYDTGGLSIKSKDGMPGMKRDMGGAAAVLGAFHAIAQSPPDCNVHALFCLAENSVSTNAMRPDDVIMLYSQKTVEVNNTDAEGRLVLGDGVAYCVKHLNPDAIIDIATLTGAQGIATGKKHGAIVTNNESIEAVTVGIGRSTGDLVHPLPYCPEFFTPEFKSAVADMKNSVKNRSNAQSSCAAQFIANQLGDYEKVWLHVDMAGPVYGADERATGYGVALLDNLTRSLATSPYL